MYKLTAVIMALLAGAGFTYNPNGFACRFAALMSIIYALFDIAEAIRENKR